MLLNWSLMKKILLFSVRLYFTKIYLYRFGKKGLPGKAERHMTMIENGYEWIKAINTTRS